MAYKCPKISVFSGTFCKQQMLDAAMQKNLWDTDPDILAGKSDKSVYLNHYGNYIGIINGANCVALRKEMAPIPVELTTDGMEISL